MIRVCIAAVAVAMLLPLASPAHADNFTFYHSPDRAGSWVGPPCHAEQVLRRIARQFDQTEARYWHTGARMAKIANARETAFHDWDPPITAKRFCRATAYLTAPDAKAPKASAGFGLFKRPTVSKAPTATKVPGKAPTKAPGPKGHQKYEMYYWLRSEQGFAGQGWGVEFCLVGRDRHMAYAPQCRMLRPGS